MIDEKIHENPEEDRAVILAMLPEHQQVPLNELDVNIMQMDTDPIPEGTSHEEIRQTTGEKIDELYLALGQDRVRYDDNYGRSFYDVVEGKVRATFIESEGADAVKITNLQTGATTIVERGVEKSIQKLGFYGAEPTTTPQQLAEAFGLGESTIPVDDPVRKALAGEQNLDFINADQFKRFVELHFAEGVFASYSQELNLQPQNWQEAQKMMLDAKDSTYYCDALSLEHLADQPFTLLPEIETSTFLYGLERLLPEQQAIFANAIDTLPLQLYSEGTKREEAITTTYLMLVRNGVQRSDLDQSPLLNIAEKIEVRDIGNDRYMRAWGTLLALEYNARSVEGSDYEPPEKVYTYAPGLVNSMVDTFYRQELPSSVEPERAESIQGMLEEYRSFRL